MTNAEKIGNRLMTDHAVEHAQFIIERTFDAPPDAVFAAWADPAVKRRWFVESEGFSTDLYELDFREGGDEMWVGAAPGATKVSNETRYFDIVEPARIVFAYAMIVNGRRISASLATVALAPQGAGTLMIFTEQAAFFEGADGPEIRKGGWGAIFDALERELAG